MDEKPSSDHDHSSCRIWDGHATSLAALGFFAAQFAAAAACRGDIGNELEGKMIVYGGGRSPTLVSLH